MCVLCAMWCVGSGVWGGLPLPLGRVFVLCKSVQIKILQIEIIIIFIIYFSALNRVQYFNTCKLFFIPQNQNNYPKRLILFYISKIVQIVCTIVVKIINYFLLKIISLHNYSYSKFEL